jgi:hypothetical protein
MGIILCDGRDRPTIVHGIREATNSSFLQGFIGNRINSSPVEFEMEKKLFTFKNTPHPNPAMITNNETEPLKGGQINETFSEDDSDDHIQSMNNPSGTTRLASFYIIHPYILPYLLDLPHPLVPVELHPTFLRIERSLCLSLHEKPDTFPGASTALAMITDWIRFCGHRLFAKCNFFPIQDDDIIENLLSERIPKIFWSTISPSKDPTDQAPTATNPPYLTDTPNTQHAYTAEETTTNALEAPIRTNIPTSTYPQDTLLPASAVEHTLLGTNNHLPYNCGQQISPQRETFQNHSHTGDTSRTTSSQQKLYSLDEINLIIQYSNTSRQSQPPVDQNESHLHAIVAQLLKKQSTDPSKRNLFEGLPPNIQQAIIRGATWDKNMEPTEPAPSCLDLLSAASKAKATSFLLNSLKDSAVRGECQQGHMSWLLYNGPIWPSPVYAQGLTIFSINANPCYSPEIMKQELKTSMKANHDNHLDDGDVEFLAKQDTFFPKSFHEMETQMSTFIVLLSIYFGPTSIITKSFQRALDHLVRNYDDYRVQAENNIFCTRVLYCYDLGLQKHLHHLKNRSIPFDEISYSFLEENFRHIQNEIINQRLNILIPSQMLDSRNKQLQQSSTNKKRRKGDAEPPNNKYNDDKPHPTGEDTGNVGTNKSFPDKVTNPRPNEKWTIPSSMKFKDCFYRNNKFADPPSHNGKPFCLLYFCVNNCKRGKNCNLSHADPRDVGLEATFDNFCKTAYAS